MAFFFAVLIISKNELNGNDVCHQQQQQRHQHGRLLLFRLRSVMCGSSTNGRYLLCYGCAAQDHFLFHLYGWSGCDLARRVEGDDQFAVDETRCLDCKLKDFFSLGLIGEGWSSSTKIAVPLHDRPLKYVITRKKVIETENNHRRILKGRMTQI